MVCVKAGCGNEGTVLMGEDSPWRMLTEGGVARMFCEECARQMELIGGVRV